MTENAMTENAIDKTFDPAAIEAKWYRHWEENGLFRPHRPDAEPFTIMLPPPNVTGSLHIGHALDHTLMDIMTRYERLRGKDALFLPGMDHAGIATQMVVERRLEAAGDKRANYTREQFIDKVWEWKAESGGMILDQMRRLGESVDWSLEAFTMSPEFNRAVLKVFVDLYNERLIYRDKRLVNWDPKLKTAISDLEVETREVQGSFWSFRYPLADGVMLADGRDHIVVSTTRPETMLADMAVAVHPDDERYASVVGKEVILPITGRRIKIVEDEHADPALGTGAVKITPGHDFNDFEVGKRAGIAAGDMLNMLDADANVCQTSDGLIPPAFIGLDRFDARKAVVEALKASGHLVPWTDKDGAEHDAEPRTIQTPYGDRGGVVIEPWLTDQWYVDAETLAQPAIEAVRSGAIEIVPKSWEKTYFNWMENIQPWCVSRQLWWGHRIPAWYGPCVIGDFDFRELLRSKGLPDDQRPIFVAETFNQVLKQLSAFYDLPEEAFYELDDHKEGAYLAIQRDSDVLDTWFSSALWPFGTLGWPQSEPPQHGEVAAGTADGGVDGAPDPSTSFAGPPPRAGEVSLLEKHYPNDLLVSGFDILFFWNARMAMQGIHFMKDVPWRKMYLHGLVRAADGAKMSKSKGNVVDPLGLIDQYGADALRFFMAAMESQGRDIKMDDKRVEGYRNFATNLWNAARFAQSNGIGASTSLSAPEATLAVNRWIIGEVVETVATLDKALADLRFDAAANAIYHFVWDGFCDWYLELIKPVLSQPPQHREVATGTADDGVNGAIDPSTSFAGPPPPSGEDNAADETRAVAGWVLDQILAMLHPFMPFITEELWHALGERQYDLIVAKWPAPKAEVDATAKAEVEWIIEAISAVRSARVELGLAPSKTLEAWFIAENDFGEERMSYAATSLKWRARLDPIWRPMNGKFGRPGHPPVPEGAKISIPLKGGTIIIPLEGVIDIAAEKARLTKALEAVSKEAASLNGRLSNPAFTEKAKPEAVEKARADFADKSAEMERLTAALARLG